MTLTSRPPIRSLAAIAFACLCLAAAGPATSQDYVQAPCPSGATPKFEDHLQSLWYRRFWTGDCRDLPVLGCRSGRPYWNEVVRSLMVRAPAARRHAVSERACKLGRQIGFEWTRPRAERRISTPDLKALNTLLEKAPDVEAGLTAVEARVGGKTGP